MDLHLYCYVFAACYVIGVLFIIDYIIDTSDAS